MTMMLMMIRKNKKHNRPAGSGLFYNCDHRPPAPVPLGDPVVQWILEDPRQRCISRPSFGSRQTLTFHLSRLRRSAVSQRRVRARGAVPWWCSPPRWFECGIVQDAAHSSTTSTHHHGFRQTWDFSPPISGHWPGCFAMVKGGARLPSLSVITRGSTRGGGSRELLVRAPSRLCCWNPSPAGRSSGW